jgi:transposase
VVPTTKEAEMKVMIGIDPHKASHAAVAIGRDEDQIASVKVRATSRQVEQLVRWAEPFEKRTWAIESVGGMGYLLAQQLVAQGEEVLDVPATLAARIRVLATGRSNKNDPNDAHSIAIAALRAPVLRSVEPADHGEVLRLLSKRNSDLGRQRSRVVCRLHSLIAELSPGGIAKEMYVSDAEALLDRVRPETPVQQMRFDLVLELLDDVRRLDGQIKASHRRIRLAVRASGTSVTAVYGVGPIHAAQLIGYSGDVGRFANRDAYASYNGTAPVERSSGGRIVHRLSQRGNRKVNHALHMVAVTQIRNPGTEGRIYFERKAAEGKTKKEALRSLKRQISNAVYRQLLLDAR